MSDVSQRMLARLVPVLAPALALALGACATAPENSAPTPPQPPTFEHRAAEVEAGFDASERNRIAAVQGHVQRASRTYALDPDLINAIIWVESRFEPRAKSPAGARGLMQLMPPTASAMAEALGRPRAKPFDPEFNIKAGSRYLAELMRRFDGVNYWALAAYNAGGGNVAKWIESGEVPEWSRKYVEAVLGARERFRALRLEQSQAPIMVAAAPPVPEPEPESEPAPEPEPELEPTGEPTPPELPEQGADPIDSHEPMGVLASEPPAGEPAQPDVGAGVLPSVLELQDFGSS